MNQPAKKARRRRSGQKSGTKRLDLWRPVPQLPDPAPIVAPSDPTTMIRSLGDPPLQGQAVVAEHYLAAVVERASGLATALAAAGGLLSQPDLMDDDETA